MSEHSINIIERLKAWNEYQNIILQTPTPHMFLRRSERSKDPTIRQVFIEINHPYTFPVKPCLYQVRVFTFTASTRHSHTKMFMFSSHQTQLNHATFRIPWIGVVVIGDFERYICRQRGKAINVTESVIFIVHWRFRGRRQSQSRGRGAGDSESEARDREVQRILRTLDIRHAHFWTFFLLDWEDIPSEIDQR